MSSTRKAISKAEGAMRKGDLAGAERVLSKLNSQPAGRSMPGLLLYSHVLEVQRKIPQAVAALEAAETRARQPWEKTKILNKAADLLGARQEASQAEVEKAVAFLERSVAIDSQRGNAAARRNLCALYYRLKNYEAVDLHAGLLVEVPEFATRARLWLASACFFLDEKSRGVPHLSAAATDAAALNDGDLTWLLQMLMNYRLHDEAQEVIDEALAAGREGPALSRTRAQLYYERRDFARVLEVLPEAAQPGVGEDAESRQSALFLRGRSLDALGRYAEAHECFVARNDVARNAYPAPIAPDFAAAWGGVDLAGLPAYELPASVPYVPTFMVAFPRSGTTLLDTILDTQREIATLSEVEGVMAARSAMTATGRAYPRDLGRLSRQDVDRLRKVYFDYNAPVLDSYGTFSVLVDKLPLNILHVPFMKMLFPDARFILSLRHPLDVCLSCFQQGFQLNDEMLH
ncbi:MAG: sulfotransferase, partial [Gammaproteobacteria bacterium]